MILESFIKKSDVYKNFKIEAKNKRLNHSYIIFCEDETVKSVLVEKIALVVFCDNACGFCNICQAIKEGSFPDLKIYDGKINVKDVEGFIEDCHTKSFYGGNKLYFFKNAESLTPIVQNKLLKIMEEPPKNVITVFLSSSEESLLQTVKSRAKKFYAPRVNKDIIIKILTNEGVSLSVAELAAEYSSENLDKAFKFSTNEEYINYYNFAVSLLKDCKKSSDIVKFINSPLFSKENISLLLDFMQLILQAILEKGNKKLNFDNTKISKTFNIKSTTTAILLIEEARKKLAVNVNHISVLETLLFEILEAKYKWR